MHPAEAAEKLLAAEVLNLQTDRATKPGTVRWFELQGKGCALSMLRGMIAAGAHKNPEAADRYRQSIKVKGAEVAEQPGNLPVEAADRH